MLSTDHDAAMEIRIGNDKITSLPKDLYIPPDALRVFLLTFEGPLDLLLYLIKKQNIDILDIPVADITRQYMQYLALMQQIQLELAADYLVMAALLAEIKSRLLLPRPVITLGDSEQDPRAELVQRLQDYELTKKAAIGLDLLPRWERDNFPISADKPRLMPAIPLPEITLQDLIKAWQEVLARAQLTEHHHIKAETLSLRERMTLVLQMVQQGQLVTFSQLISSKEGRVGVVVTFIAVLELLRQAIIEITQATPFAQLHIKAA